MQPERHDDDVRGPRRRTRRVAGCRTRRHSPRPRPVITTNAVNRPTGAHPTSRSTGVRRNRGAAGIDRTTIADVEEYGVSRFLDELAADLKAGTYRPLPARRVLIDKRGSAGKRPLSIPGVGDRVVQGAVKIVLESVYAADFLPCSFGFRPERSVHDALQVLVDEAWRGRRWVVETDIADCFEAIPKDRLMRAVEERVCDQSMLKLLRSVLGAGVMADGMVRRSVTGTPQGGPLSPLLCNVYLHRLDRVWDVREHGVLVRYCDDAVVMCSSREQAERALAALTVILADLGLEPKAAKTRILHLHEGGEGLEFLGFEHRWVRASNPKFRHLQFLARWPTRQAMQHARDRICELTMRRRVLLPVEVVVREINRFLRGWAGFYKYGNSATHLIQIRWYALMRLARFVAKRHGRRPAFGRWVVGVASPNQLGLISLTGIVVAPRPNRPWRGTPNAGGERRR
ncbi:MAG: group II intron reverse transcriptase/maturase [Pseudonocardiaceae bacterium]|nr:group II intron reverse transcriptase/maturase [Pseudonocardiaceae bacterium]